MITIEQFSQITTEVHSAAAAPDRWVGALELVRTTLGGTGCALVSADNGPRDALSCSISAPAMRDYKDYYRDLDYVLEAVDASAVGTVHAGEELIALNPRSEFNADWMRPNEMDGGLFVRITERPRTVSFLVAAPQGNKSFAEPDKARVVELLVPHLRHALHTENILSELRGEVRRPAHPVDAMTAPAAVLAADTTVLQSNQAFDALIRCSTGFSVHCDRLTLTMPRSDIEFRRSISAATASAERTGNSLRLPRTGELRPLIVTISPVWEQGLPHALVVIVDPDERRAPPKPVVQQIFSLTNAEAEVALRIGRGQTLSVIADELSLTVATIKTHLQHVYDKTDTHRQAELVRLLAAITP
ncbi:helix-turn-helix transcriptional regulator [Mycobacterium sp. 236(2023)]|uniref:helix-turn-helix transcriptional regulator n=1 Tax=Mycobacterium sp. 236(2023) TaxID=3038163 RepID=UPI0024153904|nr:helix-turn-helix transcriptional regulator [Mycobacterium sp. 236(2023)]MDG4663414.1 helix-turn-helix transcriptional regulator [Mycobacterium sp. 236(2023)]